MGERIQRQRTKGWRMPEGAIYVGRGSVWGNPFVVGEPSGVFPVGMGLRGQAETLVPVLTIDQALGFYRSAVDGHLTPEMYPHGHSWVRRFWARCGCSPHEGMHVLRGHDLACWCPLTLPDGSSCPCHADVLLELANDRTAGS